MSNAYKFLLTFVFAAITAASFSKAGEYNPRHSSCVCTFNGRKDYQLFDEKRGILGRRVHRKWTCEYACESSSRNETVIGSYEMTNRGEDNGNEGICEGTVYESEFSSFVMREVYTYKSTHGFSPGGAKAVELKRWAEEQGCN